MRRQPPHTNSPGPSSSPTVNIRNAKRRRVLLTTGATLLLGLKIGPASAAQIVAVRAWPAKDYTRVTIEHNEEP